MSAKAPETVAALLLAAGFSRRFGTDKRLHLIDGEPMIARTVARYAERFKALFVVLRSGEEALAEVVAPLGARAVFAADARAGMGRSLAAGIDAVADREHAVVGLADMPFVTADTLARLRAMLGPGRIVRPVHRGTPGHPVGFARDFFEELKQLQGDRGAKDLIAQNPDALAQWWSADPGVVHDIDASPP